MKIEREKKKEEKRLKNKKKVERERQKERREMKNKNGLAAILHTFFYITSLGPSICART